MVIAQATAVIVLGSVGRFRNSFHTEVQRRCVGEGDEPSLVLTPAEKKTSFHCLDCIVACLFHQPRVTGNELEGSPSASTSRHSLFVPRTTCPPPPLLSANHLPIPRSPSPEPLPSTPILNQPARSPSPLPISAAVPLPTRLRGGKAQSPLPLPHLHPEINPPLPPLST